MMEQDRDIHYGFKRLRNSYVLTDTLGNVLFRYTDAYMFPPVDDKTVSIYPILKILVIRRGVVNWEIGKTIMKMEKGDVAVLRAGVSRRIDSISDAGLEFDMYEFLPTFLPSCETFEMFLMESTYENTVLKYNKRVSLSIFDAFENIKKEICSGNRLSGDYIKGQLLCTAVQISRGLNLNVGKTNISAAITNLHQMKYDYGYDDKTEKNKFFPTNHAVEMSRIANIITKNLKSDISIDELAAAAHMSRSHFFKIFKKYNGMSVNDYILTCRIENTIKLILETKCNVLDAAYASGFTSSSGFYKAFKKITGSSPKEYIEKRKKEWRIK